MSVEPFFPSLPKPCYRQVMSHFLQNISQICSLFFISAIVLFQATITSHLDNCQGLVVSLSASCLDCLPSCHSLAYHLSVAVPRIILHMALCGLPRCLSHWLYLPPGPGTCQSLAYFKAYPRAYFSWEPSFTLLDHFWCFRNQFQWHFVEEAVPDSPVHSFSPGLIRPQLLSFPIPYFPFILSQVVN